MYHIYSVHRNIIVYFHSDDLLIELMLERNLGFKEKMNDIIAELRIGIIPTNAFSDMAKVDIGIYNSISI